MDAVTSKFVVVFFIHLLKRKLLAIYIYASKIQQEVMGCKCFLGSHSMELGIKLVQLMLSQLSLEIVINEYLSELSMMVSPKFCSSLLVYTCSS